MEDYSSDGAFLFLLTYFFLEEIFPFEIFNIWGILVKFVLAFMEVKIGIDIILKYLVIAWIVRLVHLPCLISYSF